MSPSASFRARFELLQQIGGGLSSEVYRARQLGLDRSVVIKLFRPRGPEAEELKKRFLVEARLLASIDHPRVVGLIDHGVEGDTAYMVQPDERGIALDAWRARERPLEPLLAATLLAQVLEGLAALHGAGIVHRDLKPANVLVLDGPEAKLIDLGVARDLDGSGELTSTGEFLGTPVYASPGQIMGEEPDPRNDLYAAGVIGYELVTGANPFRAASMGEVLEKQLRLTPEPPERARPGVPRPFSLFLLELLEKRREDRPASAEVALALLRERVLGASGTGVPAPPRARATPAVEPVPAPAAPPGPAGPASPAESLRVSGIGDSRGLVKPGRGRGLVAVLLVVALGAGFLARARGPAGAVGGGGDGGFRPSPAVREGPLGSGYAEAVRAELEAADGWILGADGRAGMRRDGELPDGARPLLDPDPILWPETLGKLPGAARFDGWLRRGGRVEALPEELVIELREVDVGFRRRGLPRPFFPACYVSGQVPAGITAEGALGELEREAGLEAERPAAAGPWLLLAGVTHAQARDRMEAARERLLGGPLEPDLAGAMNPILRSAVAAPGANLWRLVDWVAPSRPLRTALARALDDVGDLLVRFVYLAGRSMADEGASATYACRLFSHAVRSRRGWFGLGLLARDPGALLGGPAGGRAGAAFGAEILAVLGATRQAAGARFPRQEEEEKVCWARAAAPPEPGGDPRDRLIASWAVRTLAGRLVQWNDRAGAGRLVADYWERLDSMEPADAAETAARLVELMARSGEPDGLAPGMRPRILARVRADLPRLVPGYREQVERWLGEVAR